MNLTRRGVGAMLTALVCTIGAADSAVVYQPRWTAEIDAVFRDWQGRSSPGCAAGVYKDGEIVFERGYGLADLEHDVPITADTVFYTGSLSKQFTAFAAALAMQEGRLSPDDRIRKFLPELPAYADSITVRHLVHHTSGLRDYNTLLSIAGRRGDEAYDNPTVLRITARQKKLNFTPGEEYLYSNTGYTLLATIVERAMGMPFAAFAAARIFKPLGMDATHYHVDSGRLVKGRAFAYARGPDGTWRLDTPSNERAGAGGLYTTVRDLVRWDENFYRAGVGGEELIRRVQTPGRLNDGYALSYAWGLQVGTYRGLSIVEHAGALGGYRAHMIRFPRQHTSIVALCNLGSIAPGGLVRQVADVVIGAAFTEPRASAIAPASAAAASTGRDTSGQTGDGHSGRAQQGARSDYSGVYYSDEIDATFTVSAQGESLLLRRDTDLEPAPLQPAGGGTFLWRGMTIRFGPAGNGATGILMVDAGRVRDIRFTRIEPKEGARKPQAGPRPDVQRLIELTGELKQARQAAAAMAMQITEKLKTRDIPPRAGEIVREMIDKEFDQVFGPSGPLAQHLAEAYARHYTVEEITALIAFYESPLGRKVIETGPMIAREAMPAVKKWAADRMPQLGRELQERLRTEGIIK